jgi:hypothetical protein
MGTSTSLFLSFCFLATIRSAFFSATHSHSHDVLPYHSFKATELANHGLELIRL